MIEFVPAAILLAVTGSVIATCHKLPGKLWQFFLRRFTIVVDVSNDDPLFTWLSLWLAEHPYSKRARALTATSDRDDYGRRGVVGPVSADDDSVIPAVLFTPAPGNHLLRFGNRFVWLTRDRKEPPPGKDDSILSFRKREVFTLRIFSRSQAPAKALLEEARGVALHRRRRKVEMYFAHYDSWTQLDERDPRPLETVFLPGHVTENVAADLDQFLTNRDWYVARGIPWRRTYLFHGIHGSGKTSLIIALAGHFQMNLYLLSLGNPYLTDDGLLKLLSTVPNRSFVLLEDIDAGFNQRSKSEEQKNKLTFSGLLNALGGAGSKEGAVCFMTTNYLDRLDPALVRAGRVDYRQEFGYATAAQANRMFSAFFPGTSDLHHVDQFGHYVEALRWNMCDVQNHLIDHKDSALRALMMLPQPNEAVA